MTHAPAPDAAESEILDRLRAARTSGAGARVVGGGTAAVPPADGAVLVSTAALRGILDLRPADLVLTVRAGTPLVEVDAALREVGCRLPLRPWAPDPRATIGGAVAAAADGLTAREGFRWRDVVGGVRAALPTGEVVRGGSPVVKSVAGLDICKALVGSRGTMAVLLALDLRIESVPEAVTALHGAPLEPSAVAFFVARVGACALAPTGLAATPSGPGGAWSVDMLLEGPARAVDAAVRELGTACALSAADARARWSELTDVASAPPPPGMHRRVARASRGDPTRSLPGTGDGRLADLLRGRATWIDPAPPPPPAPASAALFERLRAAFDPDGVLRPGRGFGAP